MGAIAGCAGVPLLGAIAGCAGVPLLGEIAGCHCEKKIDQTVTPFSAAPFSTLITHTHTHKLACAIWGLCWYNFPNPFFVMLKREDISRP